MSNSKNGTKKEAAKDSLKDKVSEAMDLPLHEADESGKLANVSTDELMKVGQNPQLLLAGVLRGLNSCYGMRNEDKQRMHNKVSKAVKKLRAIKQPIDLVVKGVELTKTCWVDIKDCLLSKDKEITKEMNELMNILLSTSKSSKTVSLPTECPFDF